MSISPLSDYIYNLCSCSQEMKVNLLILIVFCLFVLVTASSFYGVGYLPALSKSIWDLNSEFLVIAGADFVKCDKEAFKQASRTRRPRWTAPEVIKLFEGLEPPSDDLLKKSDVYNFGMTCYEVVTGKYPFDGIAGEKLKGQIHAGQRRSRTRRWLSNAGIGILLRDQSSQRYVKNSRRFSRHYEVQFSHSRRVYNPILMLQKWILRCWEYTISGAARRVSCCYICPTITWFFSFGLHLQNLLAMLELCRECWGVPLKGSVASPLRLMWTEFLQCFWNLFWA